MSSNQGADARKQSNVSNGSASRRLSALFGPGTSEVEKVKPRKRYTKEDLLNKFKPTVQLDMSVFEPDRILDYADLFISKDKKPTFVKASKAEEGGDPFDSMANEATEKETATGIQPESFKSTQP